MSNWSLISSLILSSRFMLLFLDDLIFIDIGTVCGFGRMLARLALILIFSQVMSLSSTILSILEFVSISLKLSPEYTWIFPQIISRNFCLKFVWKIPLIISWDLTKGQKMYEDVPRIDLVISTDYAPKWQPNKCLEISPVSLNFLEVYPNINKVVF